MCTGYSFTNTCTLESLPTDSTGVHFGYPLLRTILITARLLFPADSSQEFAMPPVSLASLRKGTRGVVADVTDDAQSLGDEAQSTVSRRLLELGFIPGETVEVIEEIWPGGDPMAVRLGNTTFALRRREAGAVLVAVEGP